MPAGLLFQRWGQSGCPHLLHRPGGTQEGRLPRVVVRPKDRQGIADVLRWAASERLAVCPREGGTQLALGNVPQDSLESAAVR